MRPFTLILLLSICHPAFAVCIDGNCQNGFGTMSANGVDYTGKFYEGEISGFALVIDSKKYCESDFAVGETAGISHCYLLDSQVHTLGKSYKGQNKGGLVTISRSGEIIGYEVYIDGKREPNFYPTQKIKEARLKQDLRDMLSSLGQLRAKRPEGIQDWMPLELKKIPGHQVPRYSRNAPSRTERMKGRTSSVRSKSNGSSQQKSARTDLQKLALIAADLNGNRRQVNADYTLKRVYLEPKEFELRYEFLSSKKASSLDKALLLQSGQIAYCKASKLKPFRDQRMPARWMYSDRDGGKFEFVTNPNDCR